MHGNITEGMAFTASERARLAGGADSGRRVLEDDGHAVTEVVGDA